MSVQTLLEGSNPYKELSRESAKLAGKWQRSGLLEGIETSTEKNNMAMLLENQAKQLVNEQNTTGTGTNITAGNSEAWAGVALPIVRRVFGEIVAKDLVSVQPMNLPAGLIFYLDFRYGDAQGGKAEGESLYGASSDMTRTEGAFNKGLYGAGQFGYTSHQVTSSAAAPAATASVTFTDHLMADRDFASGSAIFGKYGANQGESNAFMSVIQVTTSSISGFDPKAIRSFDISAQHTDGSTMTVYPQFTRIEGANIEFVVLKSTQEAVLGNVTVTYSKGPDNLDDVGDFEDSAANTTVSQGFSNSSLEIPTVDVQLKSDTVAAKTRKLKAQWTPEFAQDLNAYHSIDAEAELTSILSEYISMEIDLEILDMLITSADTIEAWSARVGYDQPISGLTDANNTVGGTENPTFDTRAVQSNVYYTQMSWFQTLGIKLQKVSNIIHQKTLRGGANWMVISPKMSTVLESIPGFAADSAGDDAKYNMGVQKVGAINNRYTVYKNPYMTENVILMGYKGSQFLETGAVFAPYIPLIMTPLVYDPTSFTPRKGIMTRYAKKMVRPDFYGKVIVDEMSAI